MNRLDRLLARLAGPTERKLLQESPGFVPRLRVVARVALRFFWVYLVVLVVALVVTVASGMDIYHRTEVPQFCKACHEMSPNFASWQESRHQSIACIDCHARPGITGWVAAKTNGLRQLVHHFSAESISDIHVGDEQRQIVSDNCRRCHLGATRLDEQGGLVMAHGRHLEMSIDCVDCHGRSFAHPDGAGEGEPAQEWVPPLASMRECFRCHDGATAVGSVTPFDAANAANCTRCHPDAVLGNSHGDMGLGCTDCHEPREGAHFTVAAGRIADLCSTCHDVEASGYTTVHRPFAEGHCLDCHRVMSPLNLFVTGPRRSAEACQRCHHELGSGFAEGDFDLHEMHAEALAETPDYCSLCHAGHGSDASGFLIRLRGRDGSPGTFEVSATESTCTGACHGTDRMTYTRPLTPADPPPPPSGGRGDPEGAR